MSNTNFTFTPINVNRGRSFRGFGYYIGDGGISQPAYCVTIYKSKIWDPVNKRIAYVNSDYVETAEVSDETRDADRQAYIDHTINGTIEWCRQQKPDASDAEVKSFARNVLRMHHPEMMEFIDKATPDCRDVVTEIQNTLTWAMGLTTRACWMYGKWCAGGKPLSVERKRTIAFSALEKKGITKLPGFVDAWNMSLDIYNMGHQRVKAK